MSSLVRLRLDGGLLPKDLAALAVETEDPEIERYQGAVYGYT